MTTAIEQPPEVLAALMTEDEARTVAGKIRRGIGELRRLLVEFKEREGWRALGYGNLDDCCRAEFNIGRSHLYRQLAAADTEKVLGVPIGDNPESHLRPLAGKSPEVQRQAFAEASKDGAPTAEKVRQAVERIEKPTAIAPTGPAYAGWDQQNDVTPDEPEREKIAPSGVTGEDWARVEYAPAVTQSEPDQDEEPHLDYSSMQERCRPPKTRPSDLGEIEAAVLKRHGISAGKAAGLFSQILAAAEQGGATWEARLKGACRASFK